MFPDDVLKLFDHNHSLSSPNKKFTIPSYADDIVNYSSGNHRACRPSGASPPVRHLPVPDTDPAAYYLVSKENADYALCVRYLSFEHHAEQFIDMIFLRRDEF